MSDKWIRWSFRDRLSNALSPEKRAGIAEGIAALAVRGDIDDFEVLALWRDRVLFGVGLWQLDRALWEQRKG